MEKDEATRLITELCETIAKKHHIPLDLGMFYDFLSESIDDQLKEEMQREVHGLSIVSKQVILEALEEHLELTDGIILN